MRPRLALLDPSTEVQSWALNCLKEVALQDFTTDYQAAVTWLSTRSEWPLAAVFADAVQEAARTLGGGDPWQVQAQLKLFRNPGGLFAKHPEACTAAGLDRVFAQLVRGQDSQTAVMALEAASRLPLGEEWRRTYALPLTSAGYPWKLRLAAADVLGIAGAEWAVPPLLELLGEAVRSSERSGVWELGTALSTVGSPRAIPVMIALIEAENTYDTVYGLGYFGLGKMTGVQYDEKNSVFFAGGNTRAAFTACLFGDLGETSADQANVHNLRSGTRIWTIRDREAEFVMQFERSFYPFFQKRSEVLAGKQRFQFCRKFIFNHGSIRAAAGAEAGFYLVPFDFVLHAAQETFVAGFDVLDVNLLCPAPRRLFLNPPLDSLSDKKRNAGDSLFRLFSPFHGETSFGNSTPFLESSLKGFIDLSQLEARIQESSARIQEKQENNP